MEFKNFINGNISEESAIFGDFDDDDGQQVIYARPATTPLSEPPSISHGTKTTAYDPTVIMKNDSLTKKLNDLERRIINLERSYSGKRAG